MGERLSQLILLVQDDAAEVRTVTASLRSSRDIDFGVERAGSCAEGVERLTRAGGSSRQIDAVVAELDLLDSHGIATFDRLHQAAPQVPILVICAAEDEAIARLAVKRGAQDYLLTDNLDTHTLSRVLSNMIVRTTLTETLREEHARVRSTLDSIGDAVICTDQSGIVTYLNVVAERLTGWNGAAAFGKPLKQVFHIIDSSTREAAQDPMAMAMHDNRTVALTPNCVLIRRDGVESAIEDSAAPIRDQHGQVTGAVMVFHDVSEARAMALRMSHLAQHDSLTDLPNRIMFNDRLVQAMAMADRLHGRVAVLYMDLDSFKRTNDTLGHGIGDGVLKAVADRLRNSVRATDTVSRQGGDEFVVLLPQIIDIQHAEMIAQKILLSIQAPYSIGNYRLHFTASIGIAIYPDNGTDVDALLKYADLAMYRAKDDGRNGWARATNAARPRLNRSVTAVESGCASASCVSQADPGRTG